MATEHADYAATKRQQRRERAAAGLCPECGSPERKPGPPPDEWRFGGGTPPEDDGRYRRCAACLAGQLRRQQAYDARVQERMRRAGQEEEYHV